MDRAGRRTRPSFAPLTRRRAPAPQEADLGAALRENVRRAGYALPTPVQRYAIPAALAGRDVMACAQTGSGKTAAYLLPALAAVLRAGGGTGGGGGVRRAMPGALVLAPTRELASQIHEEARKFAYQARCQRCARGACRERRAAER